MSDAYWARDDLDDVDYVDDEDADDTMYYYVSILSRRCWRL